MTRQLISPPELTPALPKGLTSEQRIAVWADLVDAAEQFLLAGLRRKVGPLGDIRVAYRAWDAEQMGDLLKCGTVSGGARTFATQA